MHNSQALDTPQDAVLQQVSQEPALLGMPTDTDGAALHNLIRSSAFLDDNSLYCYLLLCTHFAETSVVARLEGKVAAVVTAYVPPQQPDTLFIWQVAVAKIAQRRGLAKTMIHEILGREALANVRWIETTVTRDNKASRALFNALARDLGCELTESMMFDRKKHFRNLHDSEYQLKIGPFKPAHQGAGRTA
ncbi:MAG: diaminobutyrate acetyltransferase [Pseudomonadales bacterium]|nr:diaminobutyrate acetyltransferase [Pseudomonadales bacterium]